MSVQPGLNRGGSIPYRSYAIKEFSTTDPNIYSRRAISDTHSHPLSLKRRDNNMSLEHLRKYFRTNDLEVKRDIEEFLEELFIILEVIPKDQLASPLKQFLEDWEATAEVCLDPVAVAELQEARESKLRGETIRWIPPADLR